MGKKSRKNKQVFTSRPEGAGDGQIVRLGEKEKCSVCKNYIGKPFTMRLGTPPYRTECGVGAKCNGCDLNLCANCLDTCKQWYVCTNNNSGTKSGKNNCISQPPVKFCRDCGGPETIKKVRRELFGFNEEPDDKEIVLSDMEHQKDLAVMYCGGFDRGSCMATQSVREPLFECRDCATSGQRKLRLCYNCGKIRCISCIAFASDQGGSVMGANDSGWNMLADLIPPDQLKRSFVEDCIKRCGDCGHDICMECVSQETLTSNMAKGRLFDCKDSGCRCVNCMTTERIEGKVNEGDTSFKCDECRNAKNKCQNPDCSKMFSFNCSRCGKAKYCSRECQVAMWASHKTECPKSKGKTGGKKKKEGQSSEKGGKTKDSKMKKSEAKNIISDVLSAHNKPWYKE